MCWFSERVFGCGHYNRTCEEECAAKKAGTGAPRPPRTPNQRVHLNAATGGATGRLIQSVMDQVRSSVRAGLFR
jgi:hypothetical protein